MLAALGSMKLSAQRRKHGYGRHSSKAAHFPASHGNVRLGPNIEQHESPQPVVRVPGDDAERCEARVGATDTGEPPDCKEIDDPRSVGPCSRRTSAKRWPERVGDCTSMCGEALCHRVPRAPRVSGNGGCDEQPRGCLVRHTTCPIARQPRARRALTNTGHVTMPQHQIYHLHKITRALDLQETIQGANLHKEDDSAHEKTDVPV